MRGRGLVHSANFLVKGPFILLILVVINLMTSPGHWWVQWAALGIGMAISAVLAARFAPGWSPAAVLLAVLLAGCTAGGYTGLAYAEYAALGGARRTEATGLGTALMFAAVMLLPPLFGVAVGATGGYAPPFLTLAMLSALSAVVLLPRRS